MRQSTQAEAAEKTPPRRGKFVIQINAAQPASRFSAPSIGTANHDPRKP